MMEILQSYILSAETIEIGGYIIEPGITTWWFAYVFQTFKYVMILLTIIYSIAIIMILLRVEGAFKLKIREVVQEAMETGRLPKTKIQRKWDSVVENSESDNIEKNHLAVIEAEKLLDDTLRAAKLSGENLESRISRIPEAQLNYKDDIIWVHKLRKKIESDRASEVEKEEAQRAIYIVQRTLKEMDVI